MKESKSYKIVVLDCVSKYCDGKPYKIYYQTRFGRFSVTISDTKKRYFYGYLNELLRFEVKLDTNEIRFLYHGDKKMMREIGLLVEKEYIKHLRDVIIEQQL